MTLNNVSRDLLPIGLSENDSSRIAYRGSKGALEKSADEKHPLSCWQFVFLQSRANGCYYDAEELRHFNWQWPTNTWFQERLVQRLKDLDDYQSVA